VSNNIAHISYDSNYNRYTLYTPINRNKRMYLHSVKESLEEIFDIGFEIFEEIEYNGIVYTDRILKLKKIKKIYDSRSR
jgi:hypothetical protein